MGQIEILGRIEAFEEGAGDRLVGRLDADHYALGELTADGAFLRKTPAVTFDNWAGLADAVLSGDPRAVTWPHAINVLALGVAVLRALLDPRLPPDSLPRPPNMAATDPSAHPPVVDGGAPAGQPPDTHPAPAGASSTKMTQQGSSERLL